MRQIELVQLFVREREPGVVRREVVREIDQVYAPVALLLDEVGVLDQRDEGRAGVADVQPVDGGKRLLQREHVTKSPLPARRLDATFVVGAEVRSHRQEA